MLYTGNIMGRSERQRDKQITREIHRLFGKANWYEPFSLVLCVGLRAIAYAIYNVFIPLVTAYGIQAIFEHNSQELKEPV